MPPPPPSPHERPGVLPIPQEITEHALTFCHPAAVAAFACTCKAAHELVYGAPDQYLWRTLFLEYPFDDPRRAVPHARRDTIDWRGELQRRVVAERWLRGRGSVVDMDALLALGAVMEQARPSEPLSQAWEDAARTESHNMNWLTQVLTLELGQPAHELFSRNHHKWSYTSRVRQLVGRLRASLGLSLDGLGPWLNDIAAAFDPAALAKLDLIRRQSRADIYALNRYTEQNNWGPFLPRVGNDCPVNWWHVDAIVNVVTLNVRECCEEMIDLYSDGDVPAVPTRPPMGLGAMRPYTAPRSAEEPPGDWAGVTGKWRRFVCFMDYRDLFAFNYTTLAGGPLNPSFFDQTSFREATRLITMELRVVSIGDPKYATGLSNVDHETYPTIEFAGCSSSSTGTNALLTGTVRMAEDGTVRWSWIYKVTEHEPSMAWSSEGVQLGSERSAAGVVGIWTGATHDDDDPAGPFWMWKVPDDAVSRWYDYA